MTVQTKEKLRAKPFAPPLPHVVILGAGASRAALPDGDKYGRQIPLLDDLPSILGKDWSELVAEAKPPVGGFEAQFSWLRQQDIFRTKLKGIEQALESYFGELELPDRATIYDYLVLGLRRKDIIATFNWDPFLLQAHRRNQGIAQLPDIRFLHGSVAFRTCEEHDVLGVVGDSCPKCQRVLQKGSLIFPESDKDYTRRLAIQRDWDVVTGQLKKAFHLTIFGYSGPVTDFKARELLLNGWKANSILSMCHAEIIDIKSKDELAKTWADFFPHCHDILHKDF